MWLHKVYQHYSLPYHEVENIPHELGDLAKAISTQNVPKCYPPTVRCEGREKLKEEGLDKKKKKREPGSADSEDSQPLQRNGK